MPYAGGLVGTPGYTGEPGMLDQAPFTLRLRHPDSPNRPHIVATTTPTGRPEVTVLLSKPGVQTWGRTRDAHNLDPDVRETLEATYPPGSTIARQELDGEQVGDVAGALWVQTRHAGTPDDDDRPGIDNDRVPAGYVGWRPHGDVRELVPENDEAASVLARLISLLPDPPENPTVMADRVAIGVDPAGGATENGISVVGSAHQHGYTLADLSLTGAPGTWGIMAVLAWYHYGAEGIAMERTYGGDQTDHVIATAAAALGLPLPAALRAPTQEGKKQRAIPVQALAQVHRLHHVGVFPRLEGEQCHPAGTMITTARGQVPIEAVTVRDQVLTREGWAPLSWAGQTGVTDCLVSITHESGVVTCTPCHPVFLGETTEFVPASTVRPSDLLSVLPEARTQSPGAATGGRRWARGRATTAAVVTGASSTALSTSTTTDPSQMAPSSITMTTTTGTTGSATFSPSLPKNTPTSMDKGEGERTGPPSKRQRTRRRSRRGGLPTRARTWFARSAARLSGHATCVPSAAPIRSAVVSVRTVATVSDTPVFNLTVAPGYLPEFYADGVLVHNCTWVEDETPESPNRLDAWVHAVRHLLVRAKQGTVNRPASTRRVRTTGSTWAGGTSGRRRA